MRQSNSLNHNAMNKEVPRLFREINIWRRSGRDKATVYRCLQVLPDDQYFVKAVDHYHQPWNLDEVRIRDFYFIDSMFGDGLNYDANDIGSTLEEAIAKFDAKYGI